MQKKPHAKAAKAAKERVETICLGTGLFIVQWVFLLTADLRFLRVLGGLCVRPLSRVGIVTAKTPTNRSRSKIAPGAELWCKLVRCAAIALLLGGFFPQTLLGADTWQETLARMPLHTNAKEINRTNCVETMLSAFCSNEVVKALVFMPGATDEFYLFRRARADLKKANPTLFDAVTALTNQTFIHATFRAPFLLLHTEEDPLQRDNEIQDQETAERLREQTRLLFLSCNDRDWDYLQPILKRALKINLRPWRYSARSWHFYRNSFAAWNVNGLEALELASFAGKSRFILGRKEARFEVDPRAYAPPKFDVHLQ